MTNDESSADGQFENSLKRVMQSSELRRVFPGLALSSMLSNVLAIALPLAILQIMDRVVGNQSVNTLVLIALGVVLAILLEELLRNINTLITSWLGARFEHQASMAALDRMMHTPMQRYQREEPGAYAERILAAAQVSEFYSGRALLTLFDLPFAILFLALVYAIGGWLVIVPLTLLMIFALVTMLFGRSMRDRIVQRHVMDDRRHSFLAEVLINIHSVKTMLMEALMLRRYERLQESNAELGELLVRSTAMASSMGVLFSQLMIISVVFAGAASVTMGLMTPGGLAACMMLSVRALQPLRSGFSFWMKYQAFGAAHKRLNEVLDLPVESGGEKLQPVRQSLELRNIHLASENGVPLFKGLSLSVAAGTCVAIKGESGSGKTTLLSLLNGFAQADSGEVLIDGAPLAKYSPDSVHKEIALLSQSSTIMAGTILENMTMFDNSRVQGALSLARELGLDQVVAGMKLGYETPLGEGVSETLPEGIRQLISIVRSLATDPSVILCDEANIALDMRSDSLLREYFAAQKGKRTLVLVTHRPSLLSLADSRFELADGQLRPPETSTQAQEAAEASAIINASVERPAAANELKDMVNRQFTEASDISLCLLPLLEAVGWKGDARELAEALPHLGQHLDTSDLCSLMSHLDYLPRHFSGNLKQLDNRLMPCLFVAYKHPALVVQDMNADGTLRVFDSGTRETLNVPAESLSGEVYLFQKPDRDAEKNLPQTSWFGSMFWRFRRHIVLIFVLSVTSTLLALATPLFVKSVYDSVIPSAHISMGAYLMLGALLAVALDFLLRTLKGRLMAFIGGRTEFSLGRSVFQRIITLPITAIEGASVSRQVGRIKNLEGLREFFLGPLAMLAFELPATLVLVIALAFINPWIVGVTVLAALGFALLGFTTRQATRKAGAKASSLSALRWEFLNETLTNMRAIRAVGAEQRWLKRFRELSGKAAMANFKASQVQSRIGGVAQALGTITGISALAVSAYLAIQGELSGGALMATMIIIWRLTGPMQNVFHATTSLEHVRGQMRQIENLMRMPGERDDNTRLTIRPELHGNLNFARVSFRYANDADPALLGINLNLQPGQVAVIAGENAAGKSTLLKLALRLYQPQAGSIRLDNVDIRQLTAEDLRSRVAYMPQNCEIFYGTIAQNMRLVHPAATDAEIEWALEMAGLTADIKALPQGVETRISNSRSEQLPYGFHQRFSLARVMLKPAALVLLDEPGAGLDDAGEAALMRCIQWLRGRSTVLIVSHRPGHMRVADVVVYMEHGAITAMGSYDQIQEKMNARRAA
jgi:ATP-binding cassette subfamily B protein